MPAGHASCGERPLLPLRHEDTAFTLFPGVFTKPGSNSRRATATACCENPRAFNDLMSIHSCGSMAGFRGSLRSPSEDRACPPRLPPPRRRPGRVRRSHFITLVRVSASGPPIYNSTVATLPA